MELATELSFLSPSRDPVVPPLGGGVHKKKNDINLQFFWNQSFISQNTHFQSSISTQIGFSSNLMASGIA